MSTVILSGTTLLEYVQQAQNICGTDFPIIGLNRQYHIEPSKTFNSLPHTEVDSNLSQNSERTSMNHITNRTINLYFFHFKHLITITKRKKAVFFWCESPRKIMCTLH